MPNGSETDGMMNVGCLEHFVDLLAFLESGKWKRSAMPRSAS